MWLTCASSARDFIGQICNLRLIDRIALSSKYAEVVKSH